MSMIRPVITVEMPAPIPLGLKIPCQQCCSEAMLHLQVADTDDDLARAVHIFQKGREYGSTGCLS